MKSKKTNIKIKRSKVNLYNKKKSKTKQVVAIIITAAAACALCILGYGIGKPLMDFFKNRGSTFSESSWTPGSTDSENSGTSTGSSVGSSAPEQEPPPPEKKNSIYFLSGEAALSTASLSAELAAAKAAGHSVVAVTLKDSDGIFLYKSSIDKISTKGTLSAAQIAEEIEKAGFIPAAKISTVKDKTNGPALGCQYKFSYGGTWIDDRADRGGKTWLSPFDDKTLAFIKGITSELSQAGFKRIIAADTMYPNFFVVDIKSNLAHLPLSDSTKRAEALWNVINAAKDGAETGGAKLYIEMDGASLITDKRDGTNAELVNSAASLKTAKLIVNYSPADSADNAYNAAKEFASGMNKALGGAECAVRITGSFSASMLENVKKAFDEAGIESFSQ